MRRYCQALAARFNSAGACPYALENALEKAAALPKPARRAVSFTASPAARCRRASVSRQELRYAIGVIPTVARNADMNALLDMAVRSARSSTVHCRDGAS